MTVWRGVAVLLLAASPVWAGWPDGVPGAEVGRMVRDAMAAAGVGTGEFADPVRGFPACDGDVAVSPRVGGWATAEVRCASPVWVRAIRTGAGNSGADFGAEFGTTRQGGGGGGGEPDVVTLVRSVAKGAVIGVGDVALRPMGARGVDGIFTDPAAVIGRRARAHLGEGQAVLVRQLEPDWLVEAGAPLVLTAVAGGLAVSAPAEALEDGVLGDVIRVINLSSRREVKALVTGRNIVTAQTNMR